MRDESNGDIYIVGGYSDLHGFNFNTYVWRTKCNRWLKYQQDKGLFTHVFYSLTTHQQLRVVKKVFFSNLFNLHKLSKQTFSLFLFLFFVYLNSLVFNLQIQDRE